MQSVAFSITPTPPFRLDLTALAFGRRPVNIVDTWNGEIYSRVLVIHDAAVLVQVMQSGAARSPRLHIKAQAHRIPRDARTHITKCLELLLGFRINLRPFYRRPKPIYASASLSAAELSMPALRRFGFSTNKGIALKQLSKEMVSGHFDSQSLAQLGNEQALERLLTLRGIGRWTAEYALLRGLGRTDVFPADDIGARNNLARWLKIKRNFDYRSVKEILGHWHPYPGMIYFHLLLDSLKSIDSEPQRPGTGNQAPAA